jgi:hypothetical protein
MGEGYYYGKGGMEGKEDGVGKASGWIRREGEMDGEEEKKKSDQSSIVKID